MIGQIREGIAEVFDVINEYGMIIYPALIWCVGVSLLVGVSIR